MADQNELPPKYYLEYFNYLLDFVQEKYRHILNENEWRFLRKYYCLSEDAQCLFIRFSNRKGLFFKVNKLAYAELTDIPSLLNELLDREFIEPVNAGKHETFSKELLGVFGKDELANRFTKIIAATEEKVPNAERISYKKLKKDELVETLLKSFSFEEIVEAIQDLEPVVKVCFEFEVTFMKFLFFGNRYLDMTEFVVRDLGLVQYESHDDDKLVARFTTRKDAEDKWLITDQNDLFSQLKDTGTPLEIYDWFMNFTDSVNDLSEVAKPAYERLILKVGTFLEKNKLYDEALNTFRLTEQVPSRERQVRTLQKLGFIDEALSLCQLMIEFPKNADERFYATDFMNQISSKKRVHKKSTTSWLHQSDSITISEEFRHQVEMGVANYYIREGKMAVFSENHTWRAIFGLIFWDIVFDPSLVAFHHPFQRRPSDLYLPDFYEKRQDLIISHLASFDNIQTLLVYMGERYESKFGIANPFVPWLEEMWIIVRKAVEVINFESLKKILHEMSKNLVENLRGFPDLFMWDEGNNEYCFVEVKSPTDNLSNQQLFWLQFFKEVGVNSKVLRVFWEKPLEEVSSFSE
ncbi:VRR-NUC domain-containing protein [Emticicia agri]|uniref:phosphodiesterase I n=1 Tax=Emticicia agri TaxID=2492393 RepID=A0A4Q5LYQ2_9BACT|nr:VRR-NUC domain-containing protein [Emticicia agri]RYU94944.1 VRR-NUC domain-containing protein [Emticicia agri]